MDFQVSRSGEAPSEPARHAARREARPRSINEHSADARGERQDASIAKNPAQSQYQRSSKWTEQQFALPKAVRLAAQDRVLVSFLGYVALAVASARTAGGHACAAKFRTSGVERASER